VIFQFGGNATRPANQVYIQEHYANDYISLIDSFSTLDSKPEIWLCLPKGVIRPDWADRERINKDEVMPIIAQVAMEKDIPVIDFYAVFEDAHHLYQSDGMHPTVEGSKVMAGLIDGALRTDLKNPAGTGRGAAPPGPPLISQTVITDGYWHRVGFVRDGSNRILYVDDIEVAHDTADDLVECGQSPVQADLGTLTKPSRRPETERNVRLQGGRSRRCEHRRWRPTPQMDIAASRSQQGFVRVP